MRVRTRFSTHSASPQDQQTASRRTVKRWALSLLSIFAFAAIVLGIAAGLALPLMVTPSHPAGIYNSSTSLVDAAPSALDATSGAVPAVDSATPNDHQAEVVAVQDAAPPDAVAGSTSDGAAAAAVAPSPPSPPAVAPDLSVTDVAAAVAGAAGGSTISGRSKGTITIETFGYDFGDPPPGCKFTADVRNIEASGFLQSETGLMPSVIYRVLAVPAAQAWLSTFAFEWVPSLKDGDRVAIGCAKGHHRSVALAVLFAEDLMEQGYSVNVVHRDILKSW